MAALALVAGVLSMLPDLSEGLTALPTLRQIAVAVVLAGILAAVPGSRIKKPCSRALSA